MCCYVTVARDQLDHGENCGILLLIVKSAKIRGNSGVVSEKFAEISHAQFQRCMNVE